MVMVATMATSFQRGWTLKRRVGAGVDKVAEVGSINEGGPGGVLIRGGWCQLMQPD